METVKDAEEINHFACMLALAIEARAMMKGEPENKLPHRVVDSIEGGYVRGEEIAIQ